MRYLDVARGRLGGADDLAVASYHMGIGNLQSVIARYGAGDHPPYAELFFGSSPLHHAAAQQRLASFGDDSSTYLWRVRAAEQIMAAYRADPAGLARTAALQSHKNSAEEVLHPGDATPRLHTAAALDAAGAAGTLRPLDARRLADWHERIDPGMGELAPRLGRAPSAYRALRPQALAVLRYLGVGVHEIAGGGGTLDITSTVRDDPYQRLLARDDVEATHAYSLHTTGFTFDVERAYASPRQAQAFQFLLDRLTALDLIAWVREPAAIHVTVAGDAARLLAG